jgi:outer membrane receptor for ferrienterochelin and colicin
MAKRRHTTSLVNYQNTVGNGSVGTDLSTIPVIAIDRIEVLRDERLHNMVLDAIAGVINIILKKTKALHLLHTGKLVEMMEKLIKLEPITAPL